MVTRSTAVSSTLDERNALPVERGAEESVGPAIARTILRPSVQAAITLQNIAPNRNEMSLKALIA